MLTSISPVQAIDGKQNMQFRISSFWHEWGHWAIILITMHSRWWLISRGQCHLIENKANVNFFFLQNTELCTPNAPTTNERRYRNNNAREFILSFVSLVYSLLYYDIYLPTQDNK